jgi:hypothetical protein
VKIMSFIIPADKAKYFPNMASVKKTLPKEEPINIKSDMNDIIRNKPKAKVVREFFEGVIQKMIDELEDNIDY